jgi:predicted nucleic acid-binding protein
VILVDTGALLAGYDRRDQHHEAIIRILTTERYRILSPFVLAELDYMLTKIAGQAVELRMLDDVAKGVYQLASFTTGEVRRAKTIVERYADLNMGLADASLVVLAERHNCHDILTIDQRHFRVVSGPNGRPFRLLPFDAG